MKLNMTHFYLGENEKEKIHIAQVVASDNPTKYSSSLLEKIRKSVKEKLVTENDEIIEKTLWLSIYCYCAYGCSIEEFLMWDLAHKTHEQANNYITVHKKKIYRDILNKPEDCHLLIDKFNAYELLKDAYKRDVICIQKEEDYHNFYEFVHKHQTFVVKPRSLNQAHGVFRASVDSLDNVALRIYFQKLLDKGYEYTTYFSNYHDPALVLEELIIQDDFMAKFHPASVNGVRINTIRIGDKVNVYKPWFKIGRGGQFITSAAYHTYDAGIDALTGVVNTPGVTEEREFAIVHPDTAERILGAQIPKWDEALALTTSLAKRFDNIRFIAWDIVLTPDGWCVMEGNTSGAPMWQLYEDKGDQDGFEEVIGWGLKKDFWWQE